MNESTEKLEVFGKADSENKTLESVALTQPTKQSTQNQSLDAVIYDIWLHNTLVGTKKGNFSFILLENPDGDLSWKKVVRTLRGTRI